MRCKLVPAAADELEVAKKVEEEGSLIGHKKVQQNIMFQVHSLQKNQEGGVRVHTCMQFWLLPGKKHSLL